MTLRRCWALRKMSFARKLAPGRRIGPLYFQDPVLLCGGLFLLFWWDASGWLRLSLLASLLHEGGHILAFRLLVHRWPQLDVTLTGFCLHTAQLCLPRRTEWKIAAAGPGANLLAALVLRLLLGRRATLFRLGFCWANLLVGGFNLLPIPPLDGWALLRLGLFRCSGPEEIRR